MASETLRRHTFLVNALLLHAVQVECKCNMFPERKHHTFENNELIYIVNFDNLNAHEWKSYSGAVIWYDFECKWETNGKEHWCVRVCEHSWMGFQLHPSEHLKLNGVRICIQWLAKWCGLDESLSLSLYLRYHTHIHICPNHIGIMSNFEFNTINSLYFIS